MSKVFRPMWAILKNPRLWSNITFENRFGISRPNGSSCRLKNKWLKQLNGIKINIKTLKAKHLYLNDYVLNPVIAVLDIREKFFPINQEIKSHFISRYFCLKSNVNFLENDKSSSIVYIEHPAIKIQREIQIHIAEEHFTIQRPS